MEELEGEAADDDPKDDLGRVKIVKVRMKG
jgi:hypothetical protein